MIVNHFPFPSDSFAECPGIWDRFAVFASMVSRCLMPVPVCAIALGFFVIGLLFACISLRCRTDGSFCTRSTRFFLNLFVSCMVSLAGCLGVP